ncbi:transposase [Candidatus Peregrinibacteria bacterium CG_4_10_14_0_2_um_filter_43_11]|nr:MAG: transposase [Candidatus Peregrinibacteria bacterium CG_4_10_14_0_2_um_filter_43_11]
MKKQFSPELFREKYKIKSNRHPTWDYAFCGAYFVTICTKNRHECFGEIRNGIMGLNGLGVIANQFWLNIPNHFKNVELDEWTIMPNHIHGILWLKNRSNDLNFVTPRRDVLIKRLYDKNQNKHNYFSTISPKKGSLSLIIRCYKMICTKKIKIIDNDFSWQPNYHDHIIRNETELNRIRLYIQNNPFNWWRDRNHAMNVWI